MAEPALKRLGRNVVCSWFVHLELRRAEKMKVTDAQCPVKVSSKAHDHIAG